MQHPASYTVTADLSLPAFWPTVHLTTESVWIGNWHDGEILEQQKCRNEHEGCEIDVTLPKNRADLDSMTSYLASRATGRDVQLTRIDRVEPERPSLCGRGDDQIELLVYGSNVWRSSELYLAGVAASEETIIVLPDMEGVRAKFPLGKLQRAVQGGDSIKLTVWTRNGFDERTLPLAANMFARPAVVPSPMGRTPRFCPSSRR